MESKDYSISKNWSNLEKLLDTDFNINNTYFIQNKSNNYLIFNLNSSIPQTSDNTGGLLSPNQVLEFKKETNSLFLKSSTNNDIVINVWSSNA